MLLEPSFRRNVGLHQRLQRAGICIEARAPPAPLLNGVGVWLAARRLNQGKFHWPGIRHGAEVELDSEQLQALVLGLP